MQHPFGALTLNFRLFRLRKFGEQQPAVPAGDGEMLGELEWPYFEAGETSPPCFSFATFIVEQCLLKKTSILPLLTV